MLSIWWHSGFHVFCGNRISPDDATAMENLARYIIRVSFSYPEGHKQERMQYLDQEGKVVYTAKACLGPRSGDKKTSKVFPALEWLANLCSYIPNRGEQMVRYYGHHSKIASHGVNGRWKETMTPFPPSSSRRGMERSSGETGRDLFRK